MFAHTINAPFITIGAYIYSFVSCRVLINDVYERGVPLSTKAGILGRPIPILPYRSSLSYSMTNPWI